MYFLALIYCVCFQGFLVASDLNMTIINYTMADAAAYGMNLDGNGYAYVGGTIYTPTPNNYDALFLKFDLVTQTIAWNVTFGGAGGDYCGFGQTASGAYQGWHAISLLDNQNMVAFGVNFGSGSITFGGQSISKAGNISIAVVFLNSNDGSFIDLIVYNEFDSTARLGGLNYDAESKNLYVLYYRTYNNNTVFSTLKQVHIEGPSSIVETKSQIFDQGFMFTAFDLKNNVTALVGNQEVNSSLSLTGIRRPAFAKFNVSSWTMITSPFGYGLFYNDKLYGVQIVGQDVYFSGRSINTQVTARVGKGSLIAGIWYSNNTVEILIAYGTTLSQTIVALDVYYDTQIKSLTVVGAIQGTNNSNTQGVVLVYNQNLNLTTEKFYGTNSYNYGANVQKDHIMIVKNDPSDNPGIVMMFASGLYDNITRTTSISTTTTTTKLITTSIYSVTATSSLSVVTSVIDPIISADTFSTYGLSITTVASSSNINLDSNSAPFQSQSSGDGSLSFFISASLSSSFPTTTTTVPQSADTNSQSIEPMSQTQILVIGSVIGSVAFIGILIAVLLVMRIVNRNRKTKTLTQSISTDITPSTLVANTTIQDSSLLFLQMAGQKTTVIDQSEFLAIPGFIQMVIGQDYYIDDENKLSQGAQAQIFVARIIKLPQGHPYEGKNFLKVAVKHYKNGADQMFHQEVALMWRFRGNDSIISLIGYDAHNAAIIMPLYTLGSLYSFVRNVNQLYEQWTTDLVLSLSLDVFDALQIIHGAGIIHNDIKSANYLVEMRNGKYHASLTDFGVCTILREEKAVVGINWNSADGKTIAYAAPEVLMRTKQHIAPIEFRDRADVYGASIVINEILCRQSPWPSTSNAQELIDMILNGNRPSIDPVVVDQSSVVYELISLIQAGWVAQFESRPTANQMYQSLQYIYNNNYDMSVTHSAFQ